MNSITIKIQDEETFWNESAEEAQRIDDGAQQFSDNVLVFTSIDQMRSVLTEKRLELLRTIRRDEPNSIYALAQQTGRTPANVNQDVQLLADLGLIQLEEQNDARNSIAPHVSYETVHVEIAV